MTTPPRALLLDLDGTLCVGDEALPGAVAALARVRAAGLPFRVVTNTTTRTRASLGRRLAGMGFDITSEQIVTPALAAASWLRAQGAPRCRLLVADELRDDFAGLTLAHDTPDFVVLGDMKDAWSYDRLDDAFRALMDGARLVALHKGRFWRTASGLTMDIGAFVAGLEYVTGQTAVVVGKPSREFFEQALAGLGVPAAEAVMIGDDVSSDVGGAQAAGLRGVLVRTGKYRADAVARSGVAPDLVIDSVAEIPEALTSLTTTPRAVGSVSGRGGTSARLVDLSHVLRNGMDAYPGLPAPRFEAILDHEASRPRYQGQAEFHLGRAEMAGNTGTYIDSPFHRHKDAADLATLPLDRVAALPGRLLDASGAGPGAVTLPIDAGLRGCAVLVRTGWDARWGSSRYWEPGPFLSAETARRLVAAGIALLGVDFSNVDDTTDAARPVHTRLLAAGIPIVEHLAGLDALSGGEFRFFAAPLPIEGGSSFSVRAFAELAERR